MRRTYPIRDSRLTLCVRRPCARKTCMPAHRDVPYPHVLAPVGKA